MGSSVIYRQLNIEIKEIDSEEMCDAVMTYCSKLYKDIESKSYRGEDLTCCSHKKLAEFVLDIEENGKKEKALNKLVGGLVDFSGAQSVAQAVGYNKDDESHVNSDKDALILIRKELKRRILNAAVQNWRDQQKVDAVGDIAKL